MVTCLAERLAHPQCWTLGLPARTSRLPCQLGTGPDCQHGSTLLNVERKEVVKRKIVRGAAARPYSQTWWLNMVAKHYILAAESVKALGFSRSGYNV